MSGLRFHQEFRGQQTSRLLSVTQTATEVASKFGSLPIINQFRVQKCGNLVVYTFRSLPLPVVGAVVW